jgi:L-gulonate 5-dehydrogenase
VRGVLLHGDRTATLVEVDQPRPQAGQVLVRVEANGVCGSDLNSYRGQNPRARFPKLFGHEVAGTVEEVGDGVDAGLVGTRVAVESNQSCGDCRYCAVGLPNICRGYRVLGEGPELPGGCADYVAVPLHTVHVLPEGMSAIDGALVQPLAICYEGAVRRGQAAAGERVLVMGAGPIGLGAMLFARLEGAEVAIVDLLDSRLATAKELGATHTLRADDETLDQFIMDWTGGWGVDLAIEAVGGKQAASLHTAQRLTASRGRLVVLGSFSDPQIPVAVGDLKRRELSLIGSSGHPGTYAPVIDHVASGRLRPAALVSHVVGLDDVPEIFRKLDQRADGILKVVVAP